MGSIGVSAAFQFRIEKRIGNTDHSLKMKTDPSRSLYEKYYAASEPILKVTLLEGKEYQGVFVGFCRGDDHYGEAYVIRWHLHTSSGIGAYKCITYRLENVIWMQQSQIDNLKI